MSSPSLENMSDPNEDPVNKAASVHPSICNAATVALLVVFSQIWFCGAVHCVHAKAFAARATAAHAKHDICTITKLGCCKNSA